MTPYYNIGFNLVAAASRVAQNTPALFLVAPGYAVADINMRYRFTKQLSLSLTVNNLTDKLFYDQLHPFHVIPGAGRTALIAAKAVF